MPDASQSLAATTFVFLLAGFVKGVIGLGLPTVAIGLLGLIMPPAQAAALLVVPSLVTNLWQAAAGPHVVPLLRRLWPMIAGICAGTWAGSGLLTGDDSGGATTALGAVLVLYAIVSLAAVPLRVPARAEYWASPLTGAATGVVTAATGVLVIPAVIYLQALALDKDELVQALGLSFTASTVALAVSLTHEGVLEPTVAGVSLLVLAPALAGMWIGQLVRARVRATTFRLCFFLGLLAIGGHLALRHLI